jgi:tRNA (guanine-N7-)-methyltransferase
LTVRRARRLPAEQLAPFLLPLPDPPHWLDFAAVFGNPNPVELEVGSGKGLFLLRTAQERPGVNFVGVEIERKYQLFTATRIAKRNLTNVRLVCADARQFLRDCVSADSLHGLHVYFPDPWWKTRHHKRRVFTAEFAAQCERVLAPGGTLSFASDVEAYAQTTFDLVAALPRLHWLPPPLPGTPAHDMDYLTNFERKASQRGRAVHRGSWQKH